MSESDYLNMEIYASPCPDFWPPRENSEINAILQSTIQFCANTRSSAP
jgi:hypothetical protein